jgi:hypothetical protein
VARARLEIGNDKSPSPIKGDVKSNSFPWLGAGSFLVSASSPLLELAPSRVVYSDLRSSFASSHEAAKFSSPLWFHFPYRDGALQFVKLASVTVAELPTMVLSETRGL